MFRWLNVLLMYAAYPAIVNSQWSEGCSMYGCKPTATFSTDVQISRTNATIIWVNEFGLGPVPRARGCVGNKAGLVCQSNGPGPADTGYIGVSLEDGSARWRDPILRFPSLPVMDATGTIWGSDGHTLMSYDVMGRPLMSNLPLDPPMHPLYSLQIIDAESSSSPMLLFVSENGRIATTLTDGTPIASMVLTGTVERANGTFIPTTFPVVNNNRFYVMTEFSPDEIKADVLGLQRLYAIDASASMPNRLQVAWYVNFEREHLSVSVDFTIERLPSRNIEDETSPTLLFDSALSTIYVSQPPPMSRQTQGKAYFWAFQDQGTSAIQIYKTDLSVVNMAMFDSVNSSNAGRQLWVSTTDQRLIALKHDGSISKELDLKGILKSNFTITSKITITRLKPYEEDFLLFGVAIDSPRDGFLQVLKQFNIDITEPNKNYLICLDTPENLVAGNEREDLPAAMPLAWIVPVPEDTRLEGQIVAINTGPGTGTVVAMGQNAGHFSKLFAVK